jgi:protein SCO1/2
MFLILLLCFGASASAQLSPSQLANASLAPPPGAAAPLALRFKSTDGEVGTLKEALAVRPSVLVFVDYTCQTVCGPALAIASGALAESGLPPENFHLVVVGLDEKDSAKDALELAERTLNPRVRSATTLLLGTEGSAGRLAEALGYQYSYDAAADQFAHPAGAIVLTPDGHVSRVLASLALNPQDLRLALVEAGAGRIGSFGDRLRLLCYGFDAAHGVYSLSVMRLLQLLGLLTIVSLIALILLSRRGRKAVEGAR